MQKTKWMCYLTRALCCVFLAAPIGLLYFVFKQEGKGAAPPRVGVTGTEEEGLENSDLSHKPGIKLSCSAFPHHLRGTRNFR